MPAEPTLASSSVPTDADAVALLQGLVATPSISGHEQEAVAFLVSWMQRFGMNARIDATGNAVGIAGEGQPEIVLLGHIDTVPGAVPVRIDGGKLYGRGAVDAKGPLAAFAVAAARLHARQAVEGRVVVVGCVEEEAPSSRGAHGVLDVYRPDFCIVGEPSGTDTITLGYKGSLRIRVRVTQESGHSAHDRRTAAESGFLLWQAIQEWASRLNRSRPRAWDQLLPALVGIHSGGDGLGDWCDLDLSLRLPEDMPPPNAEAQLRTLAGAARLEVLGSVPAFRAPRTSPVVRALIAGLRGEGLDPRFVVKTGTSDMNLAGPAWNCPIATYGPGDAALDHTPDEHIDLDDYLRAIRVLEHALIRLSSTRPITEATSYGYDLRAAGPGTFSDKSGAMCRPL